MRRKRFDLLGGPGSGDRARFLGGAANCGLASSATAASRITAGVGDRLSLGSGGGVTQADHPRTLLAALTEPAGSARQSTRARYSAATCVDSSRSTSSSMILLMRGSSARCFKMFSNSSFFLCQADLHIWSMHSFHLVIRGMSQWWQNHRTLPKP